MFASSCGSACESATCSALLLRSWLTWSRGSQPCRRPHRLCQDCRGQWCGQWRKSLSTSQLCCTSDRLCSAISKSQVKKFSERTARKGEREKEDPLLQTQSLLRVLRWSQCAQNESAKNPKLWSMHFIACLSNVLQTWKFQCQAVAVAIKREKCDNNVRENRGQEMNLHPRFETNNKRACRCS